MSTVGTRKSDVGRTPISRTPFDIRTSGPSLTAAVEERTRTVLRRRLARFEDVVERVAVRFKDINGPRGGVDTVARIHVRVSGRPPVFVEERALDPDRALSRAAAAVTRAMARTTERRAGPARKAARPSTRKRTKQRGASTLTRRTRRAKHTPRSRASRAQLQRKRSRGAR
jgi:hypothetical protein